jgi:hypothetical protein
MATHPIVTIAMDGENAWENYENDGRDFLSYFYEAILEDHEIIPTTLSDYLAAAPPQGRLDHCFAGSWINHNFGIWIGHPEDNMAWDHLGTARTFLSDRDPERKNVKAWESLYVAEGSDWFWWYGDEHVSENDEIFDLLFRENVSNIYRYAGEEPPEALAIPILIEDREVLPAREPANLIRPIIDGKVTNYFEWLGSGFLGGQGRGVAMHTSRSLIAGCYFGFDEKSLSVRIGLDRTFVRQMEKPLFVAHFMGRERIRISLPAVSSPPVVEALWSYAFGEIVEIQVALEALGVSEGDTVQFFAQLQEGDVEVDRIPRRGFLSITVPSKTFEAEMWYV